MLPAGYYHHAVRRMNQRGISHAQVEQVLANPVEIVKQSNGNRLIIGADGLGVVLDPEDWVVTVIGPGA
jgi:hypothetical protein